MTLDEVLTRRHYIFKVNTTGLPNASSALILRHLWNIWPTAQAGCKDCAQRWFNVTHLNSPKRERQKCSRLTYKVTYKSLLRIPIHLIGNKIENSFIKNNWDFDVEKKLEKDNIFFKTTYFISQKRTSNLQNTSSSPERTFNHSEHQIYKFFFI